MTFKLTSNVTNHAVGAFMVQLHPPRNRRADYRFLLLGPRPADGRPRPLLAAGDVNRDVATVDHGMATTEQLEAIARCAAERAS